MVQPLENSLVNLAKYVLATQREIAVLSIDSGEIKTYHIFMERFVVQRLQQHYS